MALAEIIIEKVKSVLLLFIFICLFLNSYAQSINIKIIGYKGKAYLSSITGEKAAVIDSMTSDANDNFKIIDSNSNKYLNPGLYRLSIDSSKWIDFVNDGENVFLFTYLNNVLDSLKIIQSESNRLYYSLLKLNKAYKTKTEQLQSILAHYTKDDVSYKTTLDSIVQLQNEYLTFIDTTSQRNPGSFVARYIKSSQLPVIDYTQNLDNQSLFLKAHALDNVDFTDGDLTFSDLFSNKTIEYLTYYRNPQLSKKMLEISFTKAIDTLLNKAKINFHVYKQICECLINGFRKFGFEFDIEYVVNNYVVKDDICLDKETEASIDDMISQMKILHLNSVVPNIIMQDTSGNQIDMSKINSDKILILFYASWCPHCKELIPQLVEYISNNRNNNLQVLAVSLDSNRNDWINFIKNNNMSWINVNSDKGWDCKAAKDYYIYATPTIFLVDKDKKIIGKPITIKELKKELQ